VGLEKSAIQLSWTNTFPMGKGLQGQVVFQLNKKNKTCPGQAKFESSCLKGKLEFQVFSSPGKYKIKYKDTSYHFKLSKDCFTTKRQKVNQTVTISQTLTEQSSDAEAAIFSMTATQLTQAVWPWHVRAAVVFGFFMFQTLTEQSLEPDTMRSWGISVLSEIPM